MKTAVISNPGKISFVESDKPEISKSDDVLLRVRAVGVCGSDMHYYKHGSIGDQKVSFPFRPGHELAAEVIETGNAVTSLTAGDKVAIDPLISCGKCEQCLNGREHTCLNQIFLGAPEQAPGALAEYLVLPAKCCYKVPDQMGWPAAVIVEPLSIGIYTVDFIQPDTNKSIAILGCGPIGLSVLWALIVSGYSRIYVTEKLDYRIDAALHLGAKEGINISKTDAEKEFNKYEPHGFDYVVECCGEPEAILQGIDLLKPGGKLIIAGITAEDKIELNPHQLRRKEITIQNVRRQNDCTRRAIEMVSDFRFPLKIFATHHFKFSEVQQAFNMVVSYEDKVIKAIISV
jgi:L-iditol 2-dehydrogenase